MSTSRPRITAWAMWFLAIAITVVTLILVWQNRNFDWFIGVAILFILGYVTSGALIVAQQPRNPIGWLFVAVGLGFLIGGMADEWVQYALITDPGSLGAVTFFEWLQSWAGVLAAFIPLIFILFPDGHPPSPRWRPIVTLLIAAIALSILGSALTPATVTVGSGATAIDVPKPFTLSILAGTPGVVLGWAAGLAMMFGGLAAVASLVLRYRRAQGDERQQIRWVATAAGAAGLAVIVAVGTTIVAGEDSSLSETAFIVLLVTVGIGVPVATGIAVLKYRLYDLGLVVKKTLVFAVVATILTAIYGILLFFVPLLVLGVGSGTGFSSWQFLVTIVIAISFAPIRRRARRLADRIVYGGRATPYEVLSDFSERLGETYSTDDVLPRMAQLLGASTGAAEVTVLLKTGERLVPSTTWPADNAVPVDAGALDEGLEVFPVTHQGEELGAITLRMSARDPMDPAKEQLVRDVASQAGLVLRNVRLISDLRESRRRIVAAQDERAKRLERNIHDGAQQQLVALAVRLRLAEQMTDRDPARVKEMLGDLQADANDALENLRDLARGVYPPLLADKGLTAALEAQARKAAVPVTVLADGTGRYPAEVEATVYFCTLEALQNVAKYAEAGGATVSLAPGNGVLEFTIADDGRGFDPRTARLGSGLQGMRDRVEALGGSLEIESEPGRGTSVAGRVPTGTTST